VETKVTPSTRLDGIDAQRFQAMIESPSFAILRLRIETELERASGNCERSDSELGMRRAQGAAYALRAVLGLPAMILAEMKKDSGGAK
jgi:hypothetical protein